MTLKSFSHSEPLVSSIVLPVSQPYCEESALQTVKRLQKGKLLFSLSSVCRDRGRMVSLANKSPVLMEFPGSSVCCLSTRRWGSLHSILDGHHGFLKAHYPRAELAGGRASCAYSENWTLIGQISVTYFSSGEVLNPKGLVESANSINPG